MLEISPTTRIRQSPYYEATLAAGATSFTTYNQMLLPTSYGDPEGEYWRLVNGVAQWDVAAQRQVEIKGPDAQKLAQILTTRDISSCMVGQGMYAPLCSHAGYLINDPVLLRLKEDQFWLSIADSNILLWSRAVAAERGLGVKISELDVSPMAIQGPYAEEVINALLGSWARELKHFWFQEAKIDGIPVVVARSGWSKQGGFELYLMDGGKGKALWDAVNEAGAPWNIGPGNPNLAERIEGGLLSWGGDTDGQTNPFEARLGNYVDLETEDDFIGKHALHAIYNMGPGRHLLGIILRGDDPIKPHERWYDILVDGEKVGDMTNGVWSPRLGQNIGFALISRKETVGDAVEVQKDGLYVTATLTDLPFI